MICNAVQSQVELRCNDRQTAECSGESKHRMLNADGIDGNERRLREIGCLPSQMFGACAPCQKLNRETLPTAQILRSHHGDWILKSAQRNIPATYANLEVEI